MYYFGIIQFEKYSFKVRLQSICKFITLKARNFNQKPLKSILVQRSPLILCCLVIFLVIGKLSRLLVVPLLLFSCSCFCALSLCRHNIRLFLHISSKNYLLQPNRQYLIHDPCIQPGFS